MKLGAYYVVQTKHRLVGALEEAAASKDLRSLAAHVAHPAQPEWRNLLIGKSPKIHNIAEIIRLVAPRRCTVLIGGETGTGKEVVARAIHAASNRARFEWVAVNCNALPENLLEAELFGHVKGAFTGAAGQRIGRFEQAHRGTLFLDEIGDMPMSLQAKILRVLQERELQRLGSSETIKVDVRVIAASNANLPQKIARGEFREDLYYRLNVVPIELPPIRERTCDIPALVHHFVEKVCREEGIAEKQTPEEVLHRLSQQEWPGNVRQLENAVEMAIALSGERRLLRVSDFPLPVRTKAVAASGSAFVAVPDHGLDFERTVGSFELCILEQALRKTGGNKKQAAELLRLKRTTLTAKLKTLSESGVAASAH
jgi:DNA-binding NtrC family response regulator